jgi:hypothetical protein
MYMFLISGVALLTPKIGALGFEFFLSLPLLLLHFIIATARIVIRKDFVLYKLRYGVQYYLFFFMWSLLVILTTTIRVGSFNIVPFMYLVQHALFSIYIFMVIYYSALHYHNIELLVKRYIKYIFILMGVSILIWLFANHHSLMTGSLDFLHLGLGNKFSAFTDSLFSISGEISKINPNQIAIGSILVMFALISYELSKYQYLVIFLLGMVLTFSAAAVMIIAVSYFVRTMYSRQFILSLSLKFIIISLLTLLIMNLDQDLMGSISKFFRYLALWIETGVPPDTFGERVEIYRFLLSDLGNNQLNLIIGSGYTTDLGNNYRATPFPNESDVLDVLFHTGLIGLLLYLFFYIRVFIQLFLLGKFDGYVNLVAKALALFFPGFFFVNLLAGGGIRSVVLSPILFVLLGLIFAYYDRHLANKIDNA